MIELMHWRIENSAEGIPLVFGDGKYPHDPPRVASGLEFALAREVERLRAALTNVRLELAVPKAMPGTERNVVARSRLMVDNALKGTQ